MCSSRKKSMSEKSATESDEPLVKRAREDSPSRRASIWGHLFRLFACWLGLSGLYAMFAVCPFCGQAGCPVGAGGAGLVGAFFALCAQNWRALIHFVRHRHSK